MNNPCGYVRVAEIDLFLGKSDQHSLASLWLAEGAVFVPDIDYESPQYSKISCIEDYEKSRAAGVSVFYILSDAYERTPLGLRFLDAKSRYFIMPRNGGPSIDFSCGVTYLKEGAWYMAQSTLAYYATYWNPLHERNEPAPPELKSLYNKAVRFLKAMDGRVQTKARTYWVGAEAADLRRNGMKLVGVDV